MFFVVCFLSEMQSFPKQVWNGWIASGSGDRNQLTFVSSIRRIEMLWTRWWFYQKRNDATQFEIYCSHTVDGRNPAQPGMYETL